jgi:alpha-tubulin suppressor-like RCC1 family protein
MFTAMKPIMAILAGVALSLAIGCGKGDEGDKESSKGADKGSAKEKGGDKAKGGDKEKAAPKLAVSQMAAGLGATCALMNNGTVRCWGRNDLGERGIAPDDTDAATPVEVAGIKDVTKLWFDGDSGASGDAVCVQHKDGKVTCWGSQAIKPQKTEDSNEKWAAKPEDIPHLTGIKDLALGGGTWYAILPDGTVTGWGSPAFNSFGNGDTSSFTKPMTPIPGVTGATELAVGMNHACALLGDGTVTCWGYVTPKQNPTKIEIADVTHIGSGTGGDETCAIKKDKTMHCWGEQQKPKLAEGVTNAKQITGDQHLCALTEAGTVFCYGQNNRGQLGIGETGSSKYSWNQVKGLSDATHISAGSLTTCAALKDGSAKCWGYNQRGQLGDGTLIDRNVPTPVVAITAEKLEAPVDGSDKVPEPTAKMDWSDLPKQCTKPEIAGKSPKLKGDMTVVSAYARSEWEGKNVSVDLGNFEMDPKSSWDKPRGKQFKLSMTFGKVDVKKKEATKVDKGDYIFSYEEDRKVATSVGDKQGSFTMMALSLEGVSPGTVKITHMDENWICGELDLKAEKSEFKGTYAARFPKKEE